MSEYKNLLMTTTLRRLNNLPRDLVESLLPEALKFRLVKALDNSGLWGMMLNWQEMDYRFHKSFPALIFMIPYIHRN